MRLFWLRNLLVWLAIIGQLGSCPISCAADVPEEAALLQGEVSLAEEFADVVVDAPPIQFFDFTFEGMVIERPGMHRFLTKHTDEAVGYVLDTTDKVAKTKNDVMRVFRREKRADLDVSSTDMTSEH